MAVHSLYTEYLSSYTFRRNPQVVPGSYRETDPPISAPVSLFYRDLDLTRHSGQHHIVNEIPWQGARERKSPDILKTNLLHHTTQSMQMMKSHEFD